MKKIIVGLCLLNSIASFASEVCTIQIDAHSPGSIIVGGPMQTGIISQTTGMMKIEVSGEIIKHGKAKKRTLSINAETRNSRTLEIMCGSETLVQWFVLGSEGDSYELNIKTTNGSGNISLVKQLTSDQKDYGGFRFKN